MHVRAGGREQRKMGSSYMHLISFVPSEFEIKRSTSLLLLYVSKRVLDLCKFQAKVPS